VGRPEDNADITPVVSSSSADFITGLVEDARDKGATFLTPYKRYGSEKPVAGWGWGVGFGILCGRHGWIRRCTSTRGQIGYGGRPCVADVAKKLQKLCRKAQEALNAVYFHGAE